MSSICDKCWSEDKKIFMKEELIEILKIIFLLIICKIPNERKKA